MTDKELRKLSRMELIDIIYQLEKKQNELEAESNELKGKLDSVRITIEESGSIAEAALGINGVFEAAQQAANQYLAEIRLANSETEERCSLMLAKAEKNAALLIEQAEVKCEILQKKAEEEVAQAKRNAALITSDAEREIETKWNDFIARTDQVIKAHAELQFSMERLAERG